MDRIENVLDQDTHNRQAELNLLTYEAIFVIGAGGIGSWVGLNLGLSGKVNHLYLYDDDIVETTNLNRTPFKIAHVGRPKVFALKELIMERRLDPDIIAHNRRFGKNDIDIMKGSDFESVCIIDCRDDIYDDIRESPFKVWKLGYDGMELTIDGNAKKTKVMGTSQGYTVTPSFICPSQLIANLVVNHILMAPDVLCDEETDILDEDNKFNKRFTFDTSDLMIDLFKLTNETTLTENTDNDNSIPQ